MKISSIELKQFKRFTHLKIEDIPESARLVVILGSNGSGKSSLFEAFNVLLSRTKGTTAFDQSYHAKVNVLPGSEDTSETVPGYQLATDWSTLMNNIGISFHDVEGYNPMNPDLAFMNAFYIRSGYRNEADFSMNSLSRKTDILRDDNRPQFMISADSRVSDNYQRIVSIAVSDIFTKKGEDTITKAQLREKLIGDAREAILRVLPELHLTGIGDPLEEGTFLFRKGTSDDWRYKNLSGGEKAAFDLILDFVVKKDKFDNTVFCIDEPETHMSTSVQGQLLSELYSQLPDACQLWISTHSIGMMRRAKELSEQLPGSVIFLDFSNKNFDAPVVIRPAVTDRAFWKKTFVVAIGDLAELIAPTHIVFCEGSRNGTNNPKFDAQCLAKIFSSEYPDVEFVSLGGTNEVEANSLLISSVLADMLSKVTVSRLIDRDDRSAEESEYAKVRGTLVLSRRDLENFLYDDEVLNKLYLQNDQVEKAEAAIQKKTEIMTANVARGKSADDIKSASGELYNYLKKDLNLIQCGNNAQSFARDTLVPLIDPQMIVYSELKRDIFGSRLK